MARVTIVTCCWKSEEYIGRTIDSVLAQTLSDWEQVIVDDGSPGDFMSAVGHYISDPRIRIIRQANGGLCNARNAGHRAASPGTEYLLFLDADDCLEPDMLATIVSELDAHPEAGMAFCDRTLIDAKDRPIESFRGSCIPRLVPHSFGARELRPDEAETPFIAFYTFSIAVPSLVLIRRSLFETLGHWDESLGPIYDDTDMWMRITLAATARYVPQRLLRRRIHGDQLTRSADGDARRREAQRKFDAKWNDPQWLSQADRHRVFAARRIKDGRLIPYLWFAWAYEHLRRHDWLEAVRCVARGARELSLHGPRALLGAGS